MKTHEYESHVFEPTFILISLLPAICRCSFRMLYINLSVFQFNNFEGTARLKSNHIYFKRQNI